MFETSFAPWDIAINWPLGGIRTIFRHSTNWWMRWNLGAHHCKQHEFGSWFTKKCEYGVKSISEQNTCWIIGIFTQHKLKTDHQKRLDSAETQNEWWELHKNYDVHIICRGGYGDPGDKKRWIKPWRPTTKATSSVHVTYVMDALKFIRLKQKRFTYWQPKVDGLISKHDLHCGSLLSWATKVSYRLPWRQLCWEVLKIQFADQTHRKFMATHSPWPKKRLICSSKVHRCPRVRPLFP